MSTPAAGPSGSGRLRPESRYVTPRFVERTAQGTREYDPYAKLFEERVIFLGHELDDVVANDIMAQLLCLESLDPQRDISMYINSPGGDLTSLTAVYDTMQFVQPDIQTVCLGQANSVAAVVLAAGTPGKRLALPGARVVLSQPHSPGSQGQVSDLVIHGREVQRQRELVEGFLARHTSRDVAKVHEDIERDRVLTAEQALEFGIVDQVVTPRSVAGVR
ncbi:ATP-dependent Clp protease proteolytic subunit [Streptomyces spinoverrucosus]|uniref:ATP-dependent Clp protease proteolytic subunit n=1 Tax=Streptomyces spinoverrucosus TaxID=284043 RepID=UPI0018C370BF|nr:ATP-dependent Clp protease proteolytic subunit [Streptomyces spinoverrucosus]MBG0851916.1 ATP-dependent Clp protease proteolytic subunit [Streptomyces spinoverrucosus]